MTPNTIALVQTSWNSVERIAPAAGRVVDHQKIGVRTADHILVRLVEMVIPALCREQRAKPRLRLDPVHDRIARRPEHRRDCALRTSGRLKVAHQNQQRQDRTRGE